METFDGLLRDTLGSQIRMPLRLVEQPDEVHAGAVVRGDDHVGVPHVVDPGNVLVPDPLDPVPAVPAQEQGRALEGLPGCDPASRKACFR